MGFLNPWIYTVGQFGLNGITTGAATGCNGLGRLNIGANGSPVIPGAGWNETEGWDPVKLLDMALLISASCSKSALLS